MSDAAYVKSNRFISEVVEAGICTGCGACVANAPSGLGSMVYTPLGPVPQFAETCNIPRRAWVACPGHGIRYGDLYRAHFGGLPQNWLLGSLLTVRTGHSLVPAVRAQASSGGVITQVLLYLLESKRIEGAILVKQGVPSPLEARAVVATSREEILACSQSVYIPVSTLDRLPELKAGKSYAITCLPDQAAALRVLQHQGSKQAALIKYVLGPYTGTALYPGALTCFLRASGAGRDEPVVDLKWRAGDWPGYLEITLKSGKVLRSNKVYYNYLIPFFVTHTSLQGMDFANEFCDLSVGDAWSPDFERLGKGHSVVITRSAEMERILCQMMEHGFLSMEEIDPLEASAMHGHMIDFKKRGSYIRNRMRRRMRRAVPDHGLKPDPLPMSRVLVEIVISFLFAVGGTGFARWTIERIPPSVLGPVFNRLRLSWKALSRPTKRKGLRTLQMLELPARE